MTKYYLHIGLHKTGTKYFQHKVFPNLPSNEFIYNPPKLTQLISDLLKANEEDVSLVYNAIAKEKKRIGKALNKKVVISREIMSGDLFSFYKDYKRTYARLHTAFTDAYIICFLRYQVDWIVSCYRETLHEHHYQTIDQFLSFAPGNSLFVNNSYKDLNFNGIVNELNERFGNNISYFFFEDFKKDKNKIVDELSKILGTKNIPIKKGQDKILNRGYSAFSIKLSIFRFRLFKYLGLARFLIHRPIYFFGPDSIPAGFEHLSVLPREKYWYTGFLRDNEEVRSKNYPNLTFKEKIKMEFSWRSIIKKRIDKLFYWDWDMLGIHRQVLDNYFKPQNEKLSELIS